MKTLFQEKKQHYNRKAVSKETLKLGAYWKLQPVILHGKHGAKVSIVFEQGQHSL